MNSVQLVGNLGADPELKKTAGGKSILTISIATNRRRKNEQGVYVDHADWHRLNIWDKQAEVVGQYLRKGDKLGVVGRLENRKFTDKAGIERTVTEVRVIDVDLIGSRTVGGRADGGTRTASPEVPGDDDIPF